MNHIFIRDFPFKFTRDFLIKKFYKGIPFNNDDDEKKSFSEKRKEKKRKNNVWVSEQKYFLILLKINIQIKKRKEMKEIKKEQKATPASLARAVPSNNDWVSEQINISALARNK